MVQVMTKDVEEAVKRLEDVLSTFMMVVYGEEFVPVSSDDLASRINTVATEIQSMI